jgi:hypothetical protein
MEGFSPLTLGPISQIPPDLSWPDTQLLRDLIQTVTLSLQFARFPAPIVQSTLHQNIRAFT